MEGLVAFLQPYVCNSNDALQFKFVRKVEDLDDDKTTFKPVMTHQVFGDNETIFGYRELKVKLYYSASKLTTYFGISFKEKVDPTKSDGVCADDVMEKVAKFIPPDYHTNIDDFCRDISKDSDFIPFGTLQKSFKTGQEPSERCFEVYQCDISVPGFNAYHERLQTFVLWYIDAANYIDSDNDNWRFFLLYEKYKADGNHRYAIVGYATVYEFFAYPKNIRPRISQMLIFPPFQHNGLGSHLLQCIYEHYVPLPEVIDITVEDPSDDFQRLRDFVDVKNSEKLFTSQPERLHEGFPKACTMLKTLKLSKKQIRRVYEILRLHFTNVDNVEEYKNYRLEIKKRLNKPYQKEQDDMKRFKRFFGLKENEEVPAEAMKLISNQQRISILEKEYQELESQYRYILQHITLL